MSHVRVIGPYAMMPKEISRSGLPDKTIRVFNELINHGTSADDCFPSVPRLASFVECSESAVREALKVLTHFGWVIVEHQYDPETRRQKANGYSIVLDFNMLQPRQQAEWRAWRLDHVKARYREARKAQDAAQKPENRRPEADKERARMKPYRVLVREALARLNEYELAIGEALTPSAEIDGEGTAHRTPPPRGGVQPTVPPGVRPTTPPGVRPTAPLEEELEKETQRNEMGGTGEAEQPALPMRAPACVPKPAARKLRDIPVPADALSLIEMFHTKRGISTPIDTIAANTTEWGRDWVRPAMTLTQNERWEQLGVMVDYLADPALAGAFHQRSTWNLKAMLRHVNEYDLSGAADGWSAMNRTGAGGGGMVPGDALRAVRSAYTASCRPDAPPFSELLEGLPKAVVDAALTCRSAFASSSEQQAEKAFLRAFAMSSGRSVRVAS